MYFIVQETREATKATVSSPGSFPVVPSWPLVSDFISVRCWVEKKVSDGLIVDALLAKHWVRFVTSEREPEKIIIILSQ